jgi:hypothetical protein
MISGRIVARFATPRQAIPHDWYAIWLVPAGMAAVVLLVFAMLFREDSNSLTAANSHSQQKESTS